MSGRKTVDRRALALLDEAGTAVSGFLDEMWADRNHYPTAAAAAAVAALACLSDAILRIPEAHRPVVVEQLRHESHDPYSPGAMLVRDFLGAVFCVPAVRSASADEKGMPERARQTALLLVTVLGRVRPERMTQKGIAPAPPLFNELPDEVRRAAGGAS